MRKLIFKTASVCMLGLLLSLTVGVDAKAATLNESIVSEQSTIMTGEYTTLYVNTGGDNLNVRSGPGTNYSVVSHLRHGTRIVSWSIFGRVDQYGYSWTSIKAYDVNGVLVSGWVRDDYLTDVAP